MVVSDPELWKKHGAEIEALANQGARVLLLFDGGKSYTVGGNEYKSATLNGLTFAARNKDHPVTHGFETDELSFWYDRTEKRIGFIADEALPDDRLSPLVFTYENDWMKLYTFSGLQTLSKKKIPLLGQLITGAGCIFMSTIRFAAFCGAAPAADALLRNCLIGD